MSIEAKNLTKQFGSVTAVDNLSLTLEEGKIYGLLGRNGAGKTTLLNMLSNRIYPTSGSICINGENAINNDKAQQHLYFMSEKSLYPESMRVKDVLKWTNVFYQGHFDMAEAQRLAQLFALDVSKKVKQLSTGYSSIFKIVVALSLQLPYIFLDEPILGLDANHREIFYRELIQSYANSPRSFVISTHLIEEVSTIIEQAIIIKHGKLLCNESVESLLSSGYAVSGVTDKVEAFAANQTVIGKDTLGGLMTAYIQGTVDESSLPDGLTVSALDLQKLFVRLTNQ